MKLRLFEALQRRSQSQSWLAAELGVSRGYVSDLVNGKKSPSVELLQRMAEVLEISPGELFSLPSEAVRSDENAVEPFKPRRMASIAAVARMIAPGVRNPETYRVRRSALGFGLLANDLLIADMGAAHTDGDIVLVDRWTETGVAATLIRRVVNNFLLSDEPGSPPEPLATDRQADTVVGVVCGTLRGPGLAPPH